ncbi:MAG TPA: hypothetical protein VM324_11970 [Egibacteraceae bacterium]|jgi:hypothetical protein|nr:hypothetical protein [Egibacteraceae bacterium]
MVSSMAERGDVVVSGLLRLVTGLLVATVVLLDGGAVLVNRVQLDEVARRAAVAGAFAWTGGGSPHVIETAVRQRLPHQTGVTLEAVTVGGARVSVTVSRPAQVLLLGRIGPLSSWAHGRATSSSAAGSA